MINKKIKSSKLGLLYFTILMTLLSTAHANQSYCDCKIFFVKTTNDNTTLRLNNVNTDLSDDYKDAVVGNRTPVVFAGGLFSNLFRFEQGGEKSLARKLVNFGRDVWEIEITGGPKQDEADDAPNYKYEDLVDYYWPALIAGVEQYSGENTIQYVGHSNGCRVALDSLKNWSSGKNNAGYYFDSDTGTYKLTDLVSNPVDTFVGVGCPGVFNGTSSLITHVNDHPNSATKLQEDGITHPDRDDVAQKLTFLGIGRLFVSKGNPISLNLWDYYSDSILNTGDKNPGEGLSLNKFHLIYGVGGLNGIGNEQDDGMVTVNDQLSIANGIQSSNTDKTIQYKQNHGDLPDDNSIKNRIKELLGG